MAIANSAEVRPDPMVLAQQVFTANLPTDLAVTPADLTRRALYDRLATASNTPWEPLLEAARKDHPRITEAFDHFVALETVDAESPLRAVTLSALTDLQTDEDWQVSFAALIVMASHRVRYGEPAISTSLLTQALSVIPNNDRSVAALDAAYDANTILSVTHTLNGAFEQSLWTVQEVVQASQASGRKIDPFTIVNNLAVLLSRTGDAPAAVRLLQSIEPHLDVGTPGQLTIYHYTTGRLLLKDDKPDLALTSLSKALELGPSESLTPYIYAKIAMAEMSVGPLERIDAYIARTQAAIDTAPNDLGLDIGMLELRAARAKRGGDLTLALSLTEDLMEARAKVARDRESASRQMAYARASESQRVQRLQVERAREEARLKDEIIAQTRARTRATKVAMIMALFGLFTSLGFLLRERLMGRKLRKSRDEAERGRRQALVAKEAKEQFLATMNHEMRTPLNAIIPLADLLQTVSTDDTVKNLARTISLGGEAMLTLVERSVTISEGVTGYAPNSRRFDPHEILQDLSDKYAPQASDRGLTFTLLPSACHGQTIEVDERGFLNVARELIENALKFIEKGGITIRVFAEDTGRSLSLEVVDTGPGIDSDQVDALLQPFSMADSTIRRTRGGAGLGLAYVDVVTRANRGQLTYKANPGGGSVFCASFEIMGPDTAEFAA